MKLFFQVIAVVMLTALIVMGIGVATRRLSPAICHGNCQRACQDLCFNRGYCPYQRGE